MNEPKKERKRKVIQKAKAPQLVHSVKTGTLTNTPTPASATPTAVKGFWKSL